jgi:tetratricopeptide (TPR) repeat protein
LHGLPLAIELAAARVRSLGLAELHAMLTDASGPSRALDLLARSGPRGADDARHASMLRVLQWSWQQLSAPEQDLLAALAACDGGASLALLGLLSGQGTASAALTVDQLVAASVVYRREEPGGASRFHAFETMREFVFHEAGAAGVADLRARHARAMAVWAAALGRDPALPAVQAEWPNLLRAFVSAADPAVPGATPEQAIDTVLSARLALVDQPLQPGALLVLSRCATAAPNHRAPALQALLALHSFHAGLREEAVAHAQAALTQLDLAAPEAAEVLRSTAQVRMRTGADLASVRAQLEQALDLARAQGDTDVEAHTLTHLAVVAYRQTGDGAANLSRYARALDLWRAHGPRARATSATTTLAIALGVQHRVKEQMVLLREARALAESQGQLRLQAFTMSVMGYALADEKRHAEAAALYRQCLQLDWDQGYWREWFYVLWNLPRALAHLRQPQAAARLMGFAEAFYPQRFGVLGREDLPEARRTRRLVAAQLGAAAAAAAWQEGAALSMADAMQLALAVTAAA